MSHHKKADHLSSVTRMDEIESSKLSLSIILTVSLFIIGAIVWAGFTQIDEVVITSGEVIPVSKVYTIQHLEGGLIKNILVKEGEEVQEGQVLVVFDPTVPRLELQQIKARNAAIINTAQELQRLLDISLKNESVPNNATQATDRFAPIQKALENSAAAESLKEAPKKPTNYPVESQFLTFSAFKKEAEEDIAQFNTLLEILTKRLTIMLQEKDMYEKLISQGVISKKDYLELLRVITQVEEEINKAQEAHLETQYSISKLEQRLNNIEVKSPIHGVVKGLQAHASNIIQPGGFLMEIVPLENLVVEARIKSSDIGLVKIGDKVRVKVDTYDFTRFGDIEGTLVKVSATTFLENPTNAASRQDTLGTSGTPTPSPQSSSAFYKGTVQLEKAYVGDDPEKNKLVPGMTVIADIHIGTKSLLKYLLKPVKTTVETSFREQ